MLKKSMESFVREARVLRTVNHPNVKATGKVLFVVILK
jgi:hypothetical protein